MSSVPKVLPAAVFFAGCVYASVGAGASLDISVTQQETGVVVLSGSAQLCDPTKTDCKIVSAGCGAAKVTDAGVDVLDESEKPGFVAAGFPFVTHQQTLDAEFRADSEGCFNIQRTPPQGNPPAPTSGSAN